MTPAAFRARVAELLRAAAATDVGQVVEAVVAYGRRQAVLDEERS